MQVSSVEWVKAGLYIYPGGQTGLIFDCDTRVKVNQFGRKIYFIIENETEDQGQSSPKLIGVLKVLRCIFWSEFGKLQSVLYYSIDKLKMGDIFTFKFNLTLKVKVSHVWWKFGDSNGPLPNLWKLCEKASCLGWTNRQMQSMTIPLWPDRPQG